MRALKGPSVLLVLVATTVSCATTLTTQNLNNSYLLDRRRQQTYLKRLSDSSERVLRIAGSPANTHPFPRLQKIKLPFESSGSSNGSKKVLSRRYRPPGISSNSRNKYSVVAKYSLSENSLYFGSPEASESAKKVGGDMNRASHQHHRNWQARL